MSISINGRNYGIERQWAKKSGSKTVSMIETDYGYWFVGFATNDSMKFYQCGSQEKAFALYNKN